MNRDDSVANATLASGTNNSPFDRARYVVGAFATLTLLIVGFFSPVALLTVLTNGAIAAAIITSAMGFGLGLLRFFRTGNEPWRWRIIPAAGLGLGALSLMMLGLGSAGLLSRPAWIIILIAGAAIGASQLKPLGTRCLPDSPTIEPSLGRMKWLWLIVVPFAAFALLAATMPPGILWPSEGGGYDALEYHLGAPRDYLDAGRITYLPHNIYSNFPFNVEMLYLLAMILRGDPVKAALTCQLLHAMLGFLAIAGIWLAAREVSPRAGLIAGVTAGATPFLVFLSGLAYVENGVLFFSALALTAMVRSTRCRSIAQPEPANAWALLSGLFIGFACGSKYTAVTATAVPIFIASLFRSSGQRGLSARFALPIRVAIGAAITMAPWLVKNIVATGNPVFPLGHSIFGEKAGTWTAPLAEQFREGHRPAAADRPIDRRIARFFSQIPASRLYGPIVAVGIAAGVIAVALNRRRSTPPDSPGMASLLTASWLMILIGSVAWIGFTHLVDRFAIVLIVPCAVLTGIAFDAVSQRVGHSVKLLGSAGLIVLAAVDLGTVWRLFTTGTVDATKSPADYLDADFFGRMELITENPQTAPPHLSKLNYELREGKKILIVGDARRFYLDKGADYCVVFNRNPFAEAAGKLTAPELLKWLGERYDFVYVDWMEMRRLQSTYGFWPEINVKLFDSLIAAGLRNLESYSLEPNRPPYATLFEVPKH